MTFTSVDLRFGLW